jgi:hypothetical protein
MESFLVCRRRRCEAETNFMPTLENITTPAKVPYTPWALDTPIIIFHDTLLLRVVPRLAGETSKRPSISIRPMVRGAHYDTDEEVKSSWWMIQEKGAQIHR